MKIKFAGIAAVLLASSALATAAQGMTPEERRAYRDQLVKILPDVPAFDAWIKATDELPPDFDALPKNNGLPDPFTFFDGKPVKSAEDWQKRRSEILDLYQKFAWGTLPPHPKFDHADVTEAPGQGFTTRTVVLHVGPEGKGTMHVTLQVPAGDGPFPVVMGPGLAGGGPGRGGPARGGPGGVSPATFIRAHGYIVAGLALADGNDDSVNIAALYPGSDVGALPRRGWAASCVVDFLLTLKEVDPKKIVITGYSRDGKSMTIGGVLDERIAAVVAGSPGVGGILSFRNAGERNMAESIQSTTLMFPDWFNPRLRYFVGREDRLPVDGNLLLAAMAPRPFIMVSGLNDEVANDWGDEQSFHSAQKVYDLLHAPNKLGINRVPGYHGSNDWEASMNFLDFQFGKSNQAWTNHFLFPWDYEKWKKDSAETVDLAKFPDMKSADLLAGVTSAATWEAKSAGIRKSVQWMLGDSTAQVDHLVAAPYNPWGPNGPPDVAAWAIGRSVNQGLPEFGWYKAQDDLCAKRPITFNGVKGMLYYPTATPAGTKLPAAVWLHSFSYPLGYTWVYHRELHPILALVQAGYAVLAYDQAGFGSRMIENQTFNESYPHWSQMGKMVDDARAGVNALAADAAIDPNRIWLYGYSLGGNVALHTAALEPKVKGVVSIAGFTPMRSDTADKNTDGIQRLAIDRDILPRLGFFVGHESQIPYDYDGLIASIAPRPVYILSPKYDRDATPADVHTAVEAARKVFALYGPNAADKLKLDEPWDYNRLSNETQDRIIAWMKQTLK